MSAAILIGTVISIYLSTGGIKSIIYIDAVQFLLAIFGIFCIGFIAYDLVGGWDLLNESLSRIASLKGNLFNIQETYNSYLAIPGTIKTVEILNENLSYNGIWTFHDFNFCFRINWNTNVSKCFMMTYASKDRDILVLSRFGFQDF